MRTRIILAMLSSILIANADVAVAADEAFGVGIENLLNKPRLASARLESSEPGLSDIGVGNHIIYSLGSKLRVPEDITLVWTVRGEDVEHRAGFKLRQEIPSHVFQLISSRTRHILFIDFRVIDGHPECRWELYRSAKRITEEGTKLGDGVVAGEILS